MNVLIIVAHGSKLEKSNDEIKSLANNIQELRPNDIIKYAFLELANPSLEETLENLTNDTSINKIKIFPYFLAPGKHVKKDIPEIINKYQEKNGNINFEILNHFGKCIGIENLIIENC